jgi:toxin ParE1/3/4
MSWQTSPIGPRAHRAAGREGVRVVSLGHYPYKIFYRVTLDAVEILHIRHAARRSWDENSSR